MKLLFDQNLSPRLPQSLLPAFENRGNDTWIPPAMQDGNHPQWSFIGRVGN